MYALSNNGFFLQYLDKLKTETEQDHINDQVRPSKEGTGQPNQYQSFNLSYDMYNSNRERGKIFHLKGNHISRKDSDTVKTRVQETGIQGSFGRDLLFSFSMILVQPINYGITQIKHGPKDLRVGTK